VTLAVPVAAIQPATTWAVSFAGAHVRGGQGPWPFHSTTEVLMKLLPLTVQREGPRRRPWQLVGDSEEIAGVAGNRRR